MQTSNPILFKASKIQFSIVDDSIWKLITIANIMLTIVHDFSNIVIKILTP